jgi:hypothetical protein
MEENMSIRDEYNAARPVRPSKCACKGTGIIKTSGGNKVYCNRHPAKRYWPRLTKDGGTEFIWLDTGEVVGHERKKGEPRVEYITITKPECQHEFDIYESGTLKCRVCKKEYTAAWALDRIAEDRKAGAIY